jgi:hypothetical protein
MLLANGFVNRALFEFGRHEYCSNTPHCATMNWLWKAQNPIRCQFGLYQGTLALGT